jgi:DNA-binding transcriptional MerR regulator
MTTRQTPVKAPGAYRTISEVSAELDVPAHVLRFWETRFRQLHPLKRGGGRRYYRPEDVALLRRIRSLLHTEGYTIKGVQRLLDEGGGRLTADEPVPPPDEPEFPFDPPGPLPEALPESVRRDLHAVLDELYAMRRSLRGEG